MGHLEVFAHRQVLEYARHLEFPADPSPRNLVFLPIGDVVAQEGHLPAGRLGAAGDEVHERRFAGAVSPDQDAQLSFFNGHIEAIHRAKAAEVHLKVLDL